MLHPPAPNAPCVQGVDAYQLHRLAADVKAAVSALGHSRCTLMAHDWGGTVAWVVAGLYGSDLLERLVVLALPHTGIAMTNLSAAQRQRSMYMLLFQARAGVCACGSACLRLACLLVPPCMCVCTAPAARGTRL